MAQRRGIEGRNIVRLALVLIGAALLLASAWMVLQNLREQRSAEQSASHLLVLAERQRSGGGSEAPPPEEKVTEPDPLAGYAIDGILSIPALGLKLPVLADYSDDLLKLSVCILERDADGGRMVIAGHNYRSHFGRLSELEEGDSLTYSGQNGVETSYRVLAVTDIAADDREALEAGQWDMTLLTCNLDMSRRVLVRLQQTG